MHRLLSSVSHLAFAPETGAGGGGTEGQTGSTEAPPASPNGAAHDASFGGVITTGDPASNNSDGAPAAPSDKNSDTENSASTTSAELYKPEGLADDLVGTNNQETIDKMLAAQSKNLAPETPADYKFEFDDKLKENFPGNPADDPALIGWSDIAHKHGLSNEAANSIITEVMNDWLEKGLVAQPVKPDDFWNALAENGGGVESGQKRVNEAAAFVAGLENSKVLTAEQKISLTQFATAAPENVAIIEALKGAMSSHGVQTGGNGANLGTTKDEVQRMMRDPRYRTDSPDYDEAFRKRTDKLGEEVFN